jgi:hypothetical protein
VCRHSPLPCQILSCTPALVPGLINTPHNDDDNDDDDDDDDVDSSVVVTEESSVVTSTLSTSSRRPTNMAGSMMGSHMTQPIGTKRAKAAAAAARSAGNYTGEEEPGVVDLTLRSNTAAAEMAANFSEMNSNNNKKDAFDMKAKEFDMKAKVFDMFTTMSLLGKKDVAEEVANTLLEYCKKSSIPSEVAPPGEVQQEEEQEGEKEEEEVEVSGSPDTRWAQNGDSESVGSETILKPPPAQQTTFLSSGFGTQALMETQSRFTDNSMVPPEGATLDGTEHPAPCHASF